MAPHQLWGPGTGPTLQFPPALAILVNCAGRNAGAPGARSANEDYYRRLWQTHESAPQIAGMGRGNGAPVRAGPDRLDRRLGGGEGPAHARGRRHGRSAVC